MTIKNAATVKKKLPGFREFFFDLIFVAIDIRDFGKDSDSAQLVLMVLGTTF
jgi:low temperature requirement protein LtrA